MSERVKTPSGYPAPTTEEARKELKVLSDLLESHDCPITRDLIAQASISVDIAHKDAHSLTSKAAREKILQVVTEVLMPLRLKLIETTEGTEGEAEDKAKVFARLSSLFLQFARAYAGKAYQIALLSQSQALKDELAALKQIKEASASTTSSTPEEAVNKLLDLDIKNKYRM
jgi:hypothetical protein